MTRPLNTRNVLDLSTCTWQFGQAPQQHWTREAGGSSPYDLPLVAEWLPATVPGTVHSDLLTAGRIADPFIGNGLEACRWVEGVDWWYRTRLPLGLQPGQRALLELDGVDYLSAVFVDGQALSRHEGMFSRQVIEIPPELAVRPSVELAVRLWGADALPRYQTGRRERTWGRVASALQNTFPPFDDRLATLKAPMHFGWDFAPRLRTAGIWDEARLVICQEVYLADVWVQAEPLALPADPGPARLRVQFTADAASSQPVAVHIAVRPRNFGSESWELDFDVILPAGRSVQDLAVTLPAARLWQPWERGEPCLYELQLTLRRPTSASSLRPGWSPAAVVSASSGQALRDDSQSLTEPLVLDTITTVFGVRSIEFHPTDQGQRWRAVVNGQPFFLRGANWVPVDALWGRARRPSYEQLLHLARQAGVNFLRVWGGGGREKDAFYDLCDELGLLVWQEFPIACVFLDHLPRDPAYLRLLRNEATGMVRALRNHPSLFLWCGGNEFSPSRNRPAVHTLAEVVAAEDGTRQWTPASPGPGDAHNWLVWHGQAPLATYRQERAAMVSEFGLQAAPNVDSLRRFLMADELWPAGLAWQRHKADMAKLQRYAEYFYQPETSAHGLGADDLGAFVAATQRAQAAGLQILIEHVRRRRGATGGLAVWQWNDPWPAISWSVIDYFGRPKLAYEMLRRTMQPLLISLEYPLAAYRPGDQVRGTLWIVNDTGTALSDGCVQVILDETPVHKQSCTCAAHAATAVGVVTLTLPASCAQLRLELRQGDCLLAENLYDLRFSDAGPRRLDRVLRRRMVDWVLR